MALFGWTLARLISLRQVTLGSATSVGLVDYSTMDNEAASKRPNIGPLNKYALARCLPSSTIEFLSRDSRGSILLLLCRVLGRLVDKGNKA